jgi:hypothetical protein
VEKGRSTKCTCDNIFLQPIDSKRWREIDAVWFIRQRRGLAWFNGIMSVISSKAGLGGRYTNSCLRAGTITELARAGFDNRVIGQITGQKGHAIIEQYKKKAKMMSEKEKREATMLVSSSGRNSLRGAGNLWGELTKQDNTGRVARAHISLVQKRQEEEEAGIAMLMKKREEAKNTRFTSLAPAVLTRPSYQDKVTTKMQGGSSNFKNPK